MAHILYLSNVRVVGLSTLSGSIYISFTKFISNEFKTPYIMFHVICKMH